MTRQKYNKANQYIPEDNVPQNDLELEQAVLGALMIDRTATPIVSDILVPNSFYATKHRLIYATIIALYDANDPVDILTVTDRLKSSAELDSVGGPGYIIELTNRVASAANIEYHARILAQKYIARQIAEIGHNYTRRATDPTEDPFETLNSLEQDVFKVSMNNTAGNYTTFGRLVTPAMDQIESAMSAPTGITGVPSGLEVVDKWTGGWQNTDLIILAARPGMGKTSFALTNLINAAKAGNPGLLFSLEMGKVQMTMRALSLLSGVNIQGMRTGSVSDGQMQIITKAAEQLSGLRLYIDDTPGISLRELRTKARNAVKKDGVKIIMVDYMQLMTLGKERTHGENREQEISAISRGLKALAKELDIPIIALSQLSRAVEIRGGSKRPQLSDLRESGSLEQDADIVTFLYRPEYYQIMEDETGASTKGICEVIFAKYRNGKVGIPDPIGFKGETAQFFNLSEPQFGTVQADNFIHSDINLARPSLTEDLPF